MAARRVMMIQRCNTDAVGSRYNVVPGAMRREVRARGTEDQAQRVVRMRHTPATQGTRRDTP